MNPTTVKLAKALVLILVGLAIGAGGIYVGETDDAPGAALIGILLMIAAVTLGVRSAPRAIRLPPDRSVPASGK